MSHYILNVIFVHFFNILVNYLQLTIGIDSNRIKLLPHWRLEIRRPPPKDVRSCENNPYIPESANYDNSSGVPRLGNWLHNYFFQIYKNRSYQVLKFYLIQYFPLFCSFTYNLNYYNTRQVAYDLGVGDDNGWVYEDDEDWVIYSVINCMISNFIRIIICYRFSNPTLSQSNNYVS